MRWFTEIAGREHFHTLLTLHSATLRLLLCDFPLGPAHVALEPADSRSRSNHQPYPIEGEINDLCTLHSLAAIWSLRWQQFV